MLIPREEAYWTPIARKVLCKKPKQQLPLEKVTISCDFFMHMRISESDVETLTSLCRWSEDYAGEEHALFVWSSLTKTFSRLCMHSLVQQGVALDRKECYLGLLEMTTWRPTALLAH